MRMLLISALTLILVSLAPSDVRIVPSEVNKVGAQAAAPSIDSSKAKFVLISCDEDGSYRLVFGVVSKEIDLSLDDTAKQVLEQGARFAQDRCPKLRQFSNIDIELRRGDPATLTDDKFVKDKQGREQDWMDKMQRRDLLKAAYPGACVEARNYDPKEFTWQEYSNAESDARRNAERIRLATEKERQRQQLIAQQMEVARAAQQRIRSEIAARSAAFVRANGVKHIVSAQQLAANPFVYQGQVVALYGVFQQMTSATHGTFAGNNVFLVSGIPTARFTRTGSEVMLAGRVLGNIEVQPGSRLVPHLSFVGSAFCRQPGCSDYAFNLK